MEYTIQKMAKLAGISTRTLRYYDDIDLLKPARINSSGYRIYGEKEVDALQQIMFFKELGFELGTIADIMKDASFDRLEALSSHLLLLQQKQATLHLLIENVTKTIQKEEGKIAMTDREKFEGFKQDIIDENEKKYGKEIREKYGDENVDASNAKMLGLKKEEYEKMQQLGEEIIKRLEGAVQDGVNPDSDEGREIAKLHKEWLTYTWDKYKEEAHQGLVKMYVMDERFTNFYDKHVEGCAQFLCDCVSMWINKES